MAETRTTDLSKVKRSRTARDQLARIVDSARDAIIGNDLNGLITSWNKSAEKLYGYTADEIIGQNAEVLFPPERRAEFAQLIQKVRHGDEVLAYESECIDKAGRRHQVFWTHSPIVDNAAAVTGVSTIAHDMTELKCTQEAARDAARYARSLIEASLDPLVTISSDGRITDVNEATVQATGVDRDKLIGSDFSGYFTDPDRARAGYREAFAKGLVKDFPLSLRHRSGTIMEVLYNATVFRGADGIVAGLFAAARDVTERKRDAEESRKRRVHLDEIVKARTAELAAANATLEVAKKELEAFAYSVSHDLRAPLRAIDGFSHILLEDYAPNLDSEGQRLLEVVRESTVTMNRMIDDILAFSRASRTGMKTESVDMEALAGAAIKNIEAVTTGRKVSFEIGALPRAYGDASMFERVWANLIDNAVKFSAPKPDAKIEIGATSGDGETVYFVRDNGVGFDMQYVDKLFGVFQRLHGAEFPGNGVGLAIVKRIVARHGGRVWAEGKPNEGATFYFALPAKEKVYA